MKQISEINVGDCFSLGDELFKIKKINNVIITEDNSLMVETTCIAVGKDSIDFNKYIRIYVHYWDTWVEESEFNKKINRISFLPKERIKRNEYMTFIIF